MRYGGRNKQYPRDAGSGNSTGGKNTRFFVVMGVALAILLVLFLRMIRPEQLVNPETFASVVKYLNTMQALDSPFLPTTWITDTISFALKGEWKSTLFNLSLSASFAFTLFFINESVAGVLYFRGFSRAQTTAKRLFAPLTFRGRNWDSLLNFLIARQKLLPSKNKKLLP